MNQNDKNILTEEITRVASDSINITQFTQDGRDKIKTMFEIANTGAVYRDTTKPPVSWCAEFACYCIKQGVINYNHNIQVLMSSGIYEGSGLTELPKDFAFSANCMELWNKNKKYQTNKPSMGCIAIWEHKTSILGHCGIVISRSYPQCKLQYIDGENGIQSIEMPDGKPAIKTIEGNTKGNALYPKDFPLSERAGGCCCDKLRHAEVGFTNGGLTLKGYLDIFTELNKNTSTD